MLVPVASVGRMAMTVMHVIDVVTVLDRFMAAVLPMHVIVALVNDVAYVGALVPMTVVAVVGVAIVKVVGVVSVLNRHVATVRSVDVAVIGVRLVLLLHGLESTFGPGSCRPAVNLALFRS